MLEAEAVVDGMDSQRRMGASVVQRGQVGMGGIFGGWWWLWWIGVAVEGGLMMDLGCW